MTKWIKIDEVYRSLSPKERRLWVALLCLADEQGVVSITRNELSTIIGQSVKETRTLIKNLTNGPITGQLVGQLKGRLGANGKTNLIVYNISDYVVYRKPYFKPVGQLKGQLVGQLRADSTVTFDDSLKTTTAIPIVSRTQTKETLSNITLNNTPPVIQSITAPLATSPSLPSKKSSEQKTEFAPGVMLTEQEYGRLVAEYGEQDARGAVEYLSGYKVEKAYKNKNDYLSIRRWVIDAYRRQQQERSRLQAPRQQKNATKHNQDVLERFNSQFQFARVDADEQ